MNFVINGTTRLVNKRNMYEIQKNKYVEHLCLYVDCVFLYFEHLLYMFVS